MTRLAVFDCDGTLVDSQANILRAMEHSFADHRLDPPCRHATRRIVGLSLHEAMQVLHPDGDDGLHRSMTESFKGAFQGLRAGGMIEEPLYPGVAEGLAELTARGWLLGVATGKSDRGLALCLAHHGIAGQFITLQTADRHPSKPHPAMLRAAMAQACTGPAKTAMIGDTSFDMEMAVAAGVSAIGVDWGYHDAHELTAAGARHVVLDFVELLDRLESQ
jgi:phosphoglycolate phosphatase